MGALPPFYSVVVVLFLWAFVILRVSPVLLGLYAQIVICSSFKTLY